MGFSRFLEPHFPRAGRSFLFFLLLTGFSFIVVSPGSSLEDIQAAYRVMQDNLNKYTTAVMKKEYDPNEIVKLRTTYLESKARYETLRFGKASPAPDLPQNPTGTTPTPDTASDSAPEATPVPATLPTTEGVSTSQAVRRAIRAISSGSKVTEKDLALKFQPTRDNHLEIKTGEDFWTSVIDDIKAASSSIHIQMFGMEADKTGWEFARMLADKVKQGVEVVIVADRSGARMMGLKNLFKTTEEEKLFNFYKASGVKVVFYDRVSRGTSILEKADFYHFDHRKGFIIDGKVGYVGGYTLQTPSREMKHDMMVRIHGSVVHQLQSSFLLNYLYNGGTIAETDQARLEEKYFPPPPVTGTMDGCLQFNIPRANHDVTQTYLDQIDAAKKYLYIINPYIPNDDMIKHIAAAGKRGVDVRLIHPGSAENPLNDLNTRGHFAKLLKAGVKIYLYKGERGLGKLHAKGMIRDDEFASIGSCNMDTMALRHNYEQNVVSTDRGFVISVRKNIFEKDFKVSELYKTPASLWERLKIKAGWAATGPLDRVD